MRSLQTIEQRMGQAPDGKKACVSCLAGLVRLFVRWFVWVPQSASVASICTVKDGLAVVRDDVLIPTLGLVAELDSKVRKLRACEAAQILKQQGSRIGRPGRLDVASRRRALDALAAGRTFAEVGQSHEHIAPDDYANSRIPELGLSCRRTWRGWVFGSFVERSASIVLFWRSSAPGCSPRPDADRY